MYLDTWTKEDHERHGKRLETQWKARKATMEPTRLLALLYEHFITDKRVYTWLDGMVFMAESGEGHADRLSLYRETLTLFRAYCPLGTIGN